MSNLLCYAQVIYGDIDSIMVYTGYINHAFPCPWLFAQQYLSLPPFCCIQVIYGDTDSIMVYTGTDDIQAARDLGARIKKEVNKSYK